MQPPPLSLVVSLLNFFFTYRWSNWTSWIAINFLQGMTDQGKESVACVCKLSDSFGEEDFYAPYRRPSRWVCDSSCRYLTSKWILLWFLEEIPHSGEALYPRKGRNVLLEPTSYIIHTGTKTSPDNLTAHDWYKSGYCLEVKTCIITIKEQSCSKFPDIHFVNRLKQIH